MAFAFTTGAPVYLPEHRGVELVDQLPQGHPDPMPRRPK
jgi:hypothetical protein